MPTYIKFRYRTRERLWLNVDRIGWNYYIDTVANNPITKGLKFGDIVKVDISKVIDVQYQSEFFPGKSLIYLPRFKKFPPQIPELRLTSSNTAIVSSSK